MGGYFSWLPSFKGAKGGNPPKKFQFFFTKSCQITISLKSEEKNHVLYAKYCIIFIHRRIWGHILGGAHTNSGPYEEKWPGLL